jgi:hypothetical protein
MGIPREMLEQFMVSSEEYGDRQRLKRDRELPSSVLNIGQRNPDTGFYSANSPGRGEVQARKMHNTDYRRGESVPWYSSNGAISIDGNDWSNQPFIPQDEEELVGNAFVFLFRRARSNPPIFAHELWIKVPENEQAILLDTINYPEIYVDGEFFAFSASGESLMVPAQGTYIVQSELAEVTPAGNGTGKTVRTWLIRDGSLVYKSVGFSYGQLLANYLDYLMNRLTVFSPTFNSSTLVGSFENVLAYQVFKKNRDDILAFGTGGAGPGKRLNSLTISDNKGYVAINATDKLLQDLTLDDITLSVDFFGSPGTKFKIQILEISDIDSYQDLTDSSGQPAKFNRFKTNPNNKLLPAVYEYESTDLQTIFTNAASDAVGLDSAIFPGFSMFLSRLIPPQFIEV